MLRAGPGMIRNSDSQEPGEGVEEEKGKGVNRIDEGRYQLIFKIGYKWSEDEGGRPEREEQMAQSFRRGLASGGAGHEAQQGHDGAGRK